MNTDPAFHGSQSPAAVVIGLDCVTGLQTSRILARHKVSVVGLAANVNHFCCRTNTCKNVVGSTTSSLELIDKLEELGPQFEKRAVLFPCTDASVLLVSSNRSRLERWYHVMLPDFNIVESCVDKVKFYSFAQKESFPIPRTINLRHRSDAVRASTELSFPCVLKPTIKTAGWEQQTTAKVFIVTDAQHLLDLYDRFEKSGQLTVQEWVEGPDSNLTTCYCYLNANSDPIASFVARKIRQWPSGTGTSSLGQPCENPLVREETIRLFRKIGFRGLGYVEFKRHEKTGRTFIIEANVGRPGVRSSIAEANGVSLIYTMYCDAVGLPLPEGCQEEDDGVMWIYWRQDLKSAIGNWWRGELTIREWARSVSGRKVCAVFSLRDMGPFCYDLRRMVFRKFWLARKSTTAECSKNNSTFDMSDNEGKTSVSISTAVQRRPQS